MKIIQNKALQEKKSYFLQTLDIHPKMSSSTERYSKIGFTFFYYKVLTKFVLNSGIILLEALFKNSRFLILLCRK